MKIPTLIGLGLLIVAIGLGIFLYESKKTQDSKKRQEFPPTNIQVVNITDTQATITWETQTAVKSNVIFGENPLSLLNTKADDRDKNPYLTHIVTLNNLLPDKKYFFKVSDDQFDYPEKSLQLQTQKANFEKALDLKPIVGTVLDSDLQPIDEALVFLKKDQKLVIATFTTAGNFLLPLPLLGSDDAKNLDNISLVVESGPEKSNIKLNKLNLAQILPSIKIGEDIDLSSVEQIPIEPASNPYDFNKDGEINSLDLAIIINNFGRSPVNQATDINKDGVVDNSDLDEIKKSFGIEI